MEKIRAIGLLSGGLDSTLAIKLILEQGIEVIALNFVSPFCTCTPKGKSCSASENSARQLAVELIVKSFTSEYFEIIKKPKFGYGRNLNPCIDCRIFKLKKAGEIMKERDAKFLITGEVVGQRPMSQRKEILALIDRESGLEGLILRPLSAKALPETIPEQKGWVNREKLLKITGRSRKEQIRLAEEFNIVDYPCPAGGCLLTEDEFSAKLKDLIEHNGDFSLNDVNLLKLGRHFRVSKETKLVVGKNEKENKRIINLAQNGDLLIVPDGVPGPTALLRGKDCENVIELATSVVAFYVHKSLSQTVPFILFKKDSNERLRLDAKKLERELLEKYRIKK